jgi:hypothetical protein
MDRAALAATRAALPRLSQLLENLDTRSTLLRFVGTPLIPTSLFGLPELRVLDAALADHVRALQALPQSRVSELLASLAAAAQAVEVAAARQRDHAASHADEVRRGGGVAGGGAADALISLTPSRQAKLIELFRSDPVATAVAPRVLADASAAEVFFAVGLIAQVPVHAATALSARQLEGMHRLIQQAAEHKAAWHSSDLPK